MSNKGQMLQDPFLNTLRKEHVQVSIYLVNGIKLQGQIESFDQYVVLLKNTVTQMVYKHAISTVVPSRPVAMPHHNHIADAEADVASARCRALQARRRSPRRRASYALTLHVRTASTAAIAPCSSRSTSATPIATSARHELAALATSAGANVVGTRQRAARSARMPRSSPARGKVDEIAARSARDRRRPRDLRPRAVRRAAAQPRAGARMPRGRPHEPDPRHLRAARAQRRRQAAGRARAAQAPGDAPGRRLDPPRAAEGRHRPARTRRNAARDRPPPDRRSA